jgi:hypothetical protein
MTEKKPRFDGFGIAMLGLAAIMSMGLVLVGSIRMPTAPDDNSVQHSMAIAAWAMVWVSVLGGGIGAFSLYLIYKTLLAAQQSAAAADANVAETRRIGEAQSRAYLSVAGATLIAVPRSQHWQIEFKISNSGLSPARDIEILLSATFNRDILQPPISWNASRSIESDIGAGETRTIMLNVDPNDFREDLEMDDGVWLEAAVRLVYDDVFGAETRDTVTYEHYVSALANIRTGDRFDMSRIGTKRYYAGLDDDIPL